jgi:hypothetical protein
MASVRGFTVHREHPTVMIIAVDKKGEEEASIEEDQSRELP